MRKKERLEREKENKPTLTMYFEENLIKSGTLKLPQDLTESIRALIKDAECFSNRMDYKLVIGACAYIAASFNEDRLGKTEIAKIFQIDEKEMANAAFQICAFLPLPQIRPIGGKEHVKLDNELKPYALQLRSLIKDGKSFFYISEKLGISTSKLRRYLKRLKLECQEIGWNE